MFERNSKIGQGGKICPCAYLIKHYAMKAYVGVDVLIYIFLISELAEGEWSASRLSRFTSEERAPAIHWV
jgi:hypothetical protein